MIDWDYFDRFNDVIDEYMPARGEGETMASQIVTAVNKLVYKWYNDGDVFDNTGALSGWCNDLSSYANWLRSKAAAAHILDKIYECGNEDEYAELLKDLADFYLEKEGLKIWEQIPKVGSIYECDGPYRFVEAEDDEGSLY